MSSGPGLARRSSSGAGASSPMPRPADAAEFLELVKTAADASRAPSGSAPPVGRLTPRASAVTMHAGGASTPHRLCPPSGAISPGRSPSPTHLPVPAWPLVFASASVEVLGGGGSASTASGQTVQRLSSSPRLISSPSNEVSVAAGACVSYAPPLPWGVVPVAAATTAQSSRFVQATPVGVTLLSPRSLVSPRGSRGRAGGVEQAPASSAAHRVVSPGPSSPRSASLTAVALSCAGGRRTYPPARLSLPQSSRASVAVEGAGGERRHLCSGSPQRSMVLPQRQMASLTSPPGISMVA